MRRYKFILLLFVASLAWSCQRFDIEDGIQSSDSEYSNVEVLEDGRIKVTTTLERLGMTSVDTRAETNYEDNIYNGWCLVFGETDSRSTNYDPEGYGDQSPLIQVVPITTNANGTFFMTFEPFADKSYMRIVANLTDRENETLEGIVSWQDLAASNDDLDETETPDYSTVIQYRDDSSLATFAQFRHQSVGLDGIYDVDYNTTSTLGYYSEGIIDYSGEKVYYTVNYQNTDGNHTSGENYITKEAETYNGNAPYPSTDLNKTTGFPMASYGFVLENLSEETLADAFGTTIDMIRVCSKVVVDVSETYDATGSGFDMQEVYLIDAPQEARIRSTVLSAVTTDNNGDPSVISEFSLPVDLGGVITYEAMPVTSGTKVSDPIYFYPNSGGDYTYTGSVDQDVNPQYIIIKGQAAGYDTPGFYKVALKAQYPLDAAGTLSELTYDVLRNTFFTVKITGVDKPGYKTFEDAADVNSPANNISYSIELEADNNHYEILVSKGTYHVELATSRVYVKGYGTDGIEGDNVYVDFTIYPTDGNYTPTVYVQSSDHNGNASDNDVTIKHCLVMHDGDLGYDEGVWTNASQVDLETNDTGDGLAGELVKIESSALETQVRVYFKATDSGRIRLRIGDILKFIPVVYEATPIVCGGEEELTITDQYGTSWSSFAYNSDSDIEVTLQTNGGLTDGNLDKRILQHDGSAVDNSGNYDNLELHTRVYTSDNSGIAQLYLRQASGFRLYDAVTTTEADETQAIVYQSTGNIYTYNGADVESVNDNDARTYVIYGSDVTASYSGSLSNFTVTNWSSSTGFSFSAKNIGTNMTNNVYVEANAHLSNTASVTLTNIAGETKTYSFAIEQYALPYTSGVHYVVDGAGNVTTNSSSYLTASCYAAGSGLGDTGKTLTTFFVYNVVYTAQKYDSTTGVGWQWTNSTISGVTNSINAVSTYVSCDYQGTDDENISTFVVARNNDYSTVTKLPSQINYYYAMFLVNCKNGANERIAAGVNVQVNRSMGEAKSQQ